MHFNYRDQSFIFCALFSIQAAFVLAALNETSVKFMMLLSGLRKPWRLIRWVFLTLNWQESKTELVFLLIVFFFFKFWCVAAVVLKILKVVLTLLVYTTASYKFDLWISTYFISIYVKYDRCIVCKYIYTCLSTLLFSAWNFNGK